MFTVNHQEAGGSFEPIAPGTYEAVITEVSIETFKTGSEGVKITLTIRADVDQRFTKRKLFDNCVYSEKSIFKFQQYTKAVQVPEGTNVDSLEQFKALILYKPVSVKVTNEEYNGKMQDRVQYVDVATVPYNSPDGAANPFNVPGSGQADEKMPWESDKSDPFSDDGRPIDISADDLPF